MVAIDFVPPLPNLFHEDSILRFYNRMRGPLVRIGTTFEGELIEFSGICVTYDGLILTIAHLLPTSTDITIQSPNMAAPQLARVVDRNDRMDLALIKLLEEQDSVEDHDYVKFEDSCEIDFGRDVLMISNISQSSFTKQVGLISYHCDTCGDCKFTTDIVPKNHVLSGCMPMLLIETSGVHSDENSFGAPLFSTRGRLVGMHVFATPNYEYFIHANELNKYMENYKNSLAKPEGSRNVRKLTDGGNSLAKPEGSRNVRKRRANSLAKPGRSRKNHRHIKGSRTVRKHKHSDGGVQRTTSTSGQQKKRKCMGDGNSLPSDESG